MSVSRDKKTSVTHHASCDGIMVYRRDGRVYIHPRTRVPELAYLRGDCAFPLYFLREIKMPQEASKTFFNLEEEGRGGRR